MKRDNRWDFNYLNKAADGKFLFEKRTQENSIYKTALPLERKMKSEMKSNSEHLFELAALVINSIWRIQFFFFPAV